MAKDTNKPDDTKGKKKAKDSKPSIIDRAVHMVTDTIAELKKVTWPSRKDLIGYTILVITFVVIVTAVIGLFDWPLSAIMSQALR